MGFFLVLPANMIFVFWQPASHVMAFWMIWAINVFLAAPAAALNGISDPPLLMRLFPRSRYGQFCSVNAFWRMGGGIVGGPLAGLFLDYMVRKVGEDNAYFFIPVWQWVFGIPCLFLFLRLYRSWEKHGGDKNYVAPIVESASAFNPTSPLLPPDEPDIDIDPRRPKK
jgi:MFS family permease